MGCWLNGLVAVTPLVDPLASLACWSMPLLTPTWAAFQPW